MRKAKDNKIGKLSPNKPTAGVNSEAKLRRRRQKVKHTTHSKRGEERREEKRSAGVGLPLGMNDKAAADEKTNATSHSFRL